MMDAYTHLDMNTRDPVNDLRLRMDSARIDRALIVETWGRDNHSCLERLIALSPTQFRVAMCFRPEEKRPYLDILQEEMVVALRIKTADIQHLGSLADSLESSGKWLLTHAEAGIKKLKDELLPLAKAHPNLWIYLPHFGWPRHDKQDDKDWEDSVRELGRLPNTIMGISAIDHFSNEPYPHGDIEPFAARLLDAFGPDSVVIGSDYPLFEKDMYARYIDLAQQWVQRTSTRWTCRFEFNLFGNPALSIRETGPGV
jgi:predicted TIM-barrel fold metal-dependent hydrolase